jgi:hypothetical protein
MLRFVTREVSIMNEQPSNPPPGVGTTTGNAPPNYGTPPLPPGMPGPLYLEPPNSVLAIISMIAGIAGFVALPLIGHIAAVICGHLALNEINNSQGRLGGKGFATAGLILGYIGLGLTALLIIFFIAVVAIVGVHVHSISTTP